MNETNYKWLRKENIVSVPTAFFLSMISAPKRIALDYVLAVKFVTVWKFRIPIIIGKRISYHKLWGFSVDLAQLFKGMLEKKDGTETIAIFSLNCPQVFGAYFGAHLSGAIPAFISPATIIKDLRSNKPLENIPITAEIKEQILIARPKVILVLDILWPILQQMGEELGDARIIVTRLSDTLPFYFRSAHKKAALSKGRWVAAPSGGRVSMLRDLLLRKSDCASRRYWYAGKSIDAVSETIAHLIYTGGSTGDPKAPMITHENIISNVLQCREHLGPHIAGGERVYGFMPAFHSYGLIVALLTLLNVRGTLTLTPAFEPKESAYLLRKRRIQICAGINRMYDSFMALRGTHKQVLEELPHLKFCISGAGKIDPDTKFGFERMVGAKILDGYGMTEGSPVFTLSLPDEDNPGSIGRPLPQVSVKIIDVSTKKELGPLQEGELVVSGPNIMAGYYKNMEATRSILVDGWLETGDTAYRDGNGFLYFVGRIKEMSKINGENVYWLEVEKHFLTSDAVQKCAVFGVPRKEHEDEEQLVAFVVVKNHDDDELAHLKAEANRKGWLMKDMIPVPEKDFLDWEDVIGKIQKRKVREYYERNHQN